MIGGITLVGYGTFVAPFAQHPCRSCSILFVPFSAVVCCSFRSDRNLARR